VSACGEQLVIFHLTDESCPDFIIDVAEDFALVIRDELPDIVALGSWQRLKKTCNFGRMQGDQQLSGLGQSAFRQRQIEIFQAAGRTGFGIRISHGSLPVLWSRLRFACRSLAVRFAAVQQTSHDEAHRIQAIVYADYEVMMTSQGRA